MDFTSFDSRGVADEGRPLHLKHPATGLPLWDDDGPHLDHKGAELPRELPDLQRHGGAERDGDEHDRQRADLREEVRGRR